MSASSSAAIVLVKATMKDLVQSMATPRAAAARAPLAHRRRAQTAPPVDGAMAGRASLALPLQAKAEGGRTSPEELYGNLVEAARMKGPVARMSGMGRPGASDLPRAGAVVQRVAAESGGGQSSPGDSPPSPDAGDHAISADLFDKIKGAVAGLVDTKPGSCSTMAPQVRTRLKDRFEKTVPGFEATGISIAWWDMRGGGWSFVNGKWRCPSRNHTVAAFTLGGKRYVVDTTEGQFKDGREGVIIQEEGPWKEELMKLVKGVGPWVEKGIKTSSVMAFFEPPGNTMPDPPAGVQSPDEGRPAPSKTGLFSRLVPKKRPK